MWVTLPVTDDAEVPFRASNFISGLILLIERPVQVGDRIAVGELSGDVKKISLRTTIVETTD
ncbi:MAG: mechanosensitive ion channel domain-containing protein, partial [Acidimicrobiales bacterium]